MKTRLLLLLLVSLATLKLFSQNQEDALRYSRTQLLGSARYMAMGGAYGSVGADFSGLSVNPAGIGLFRKSEFTLTPLISLSETETSYFEQLQDDNKYKLMLGNLGFVYTWDLDDKSQEAGWQRIQFGFGFNRINNFNNRVFIQGFNNNSSLMTGYTHMADGFTPGNLDPFTTQLAYDAWLIWPMDTINYIYDADAYHGNVMQRHTIITSGSMSEISFSIGSNYKDRLYIGASLGIPYIRYSYESEYTEKDPYNNHDAFVSLTRRKNIETRGTGLNLKLGAILRATNWLRLGAAFHTPTFYSNMRDEWRYRMSSQLIINNQPENRSAESPRGEFEYELTTPMKAIGSATILFGKHGLVTAQYEFADYSNINLNSPSYKYVDENRAIRDNYTAAHNIKLGTEWRTKNNIYFRGGYAIFGSPYKAGVNDGKGSQLSLGFGLRQQDYYIDFAWVNSTYKEDRYMYWVPEGEGLDFFTPVANQTFNRQQFMLTFGWRF